MPASDPDGQNSTPEHQREWQEKLDQLRQAYAAETDRAERFRLEQQIKHAEAIQQALSSPDDSDIPQEGSAAVEHPGDPAPVEHPQHPHTTKTVTEKRPGLLQLLRTHHTRIITVALILGFMSVCSALLFAPIGLLVVASLCFGGAASVSLLRDIERLRHTPGSHLPAYTFSIFLVLLGFCGPFYLLLLLANIFRTAS